MLWRGEGDFLPFQVDRQRLTEAAAGGGAEEARGGPGNRRLADGLIFRPPGIPEFRAQGERKSKRGKNIVKGLL